MNNTESLAIQAKSGTEADLLVLWTAVRSFAGWLAYRWIVLYGGVGGVTRDDLMQAAFLGMLAAVESYRPEEGPFITLFRVCTERAFAEWSCGRTPKQWRDPLHHAGSLDQPVRADDSNSDTLGDLVADPKDSFEEVETKIFRLQLTEAVRSAVNELPPDQAAVVRGRLRGDTREQLAQQAGVSPGMIQGRERRAFMFMRRRSDLRSFADELNLFRGVSPETFRRTHTSSTERDAMRLASCSARRSPVS